MRAVRLFSRRRAIALRRASHEASVGSDEQWNEIATEVKERMRAIAQETGVARDAILARHNPPEAAFDDLVALYQYSAGRTAAVPELIEERRFGSRTSVDAGSHELYARLEAIRAESRDAHARLRASLSIAMHSGTTSEDSYELFRAAVVAQGEYTRGRLDAVFEEHARRRGRRWAPPMI